MKGKILMPRLGDSMTEGIIAAWHKNIGDNIKKGDLLVEIETDKATMELESYLDGILLHRSVEEGDKLKVNDLLAIVGDKEEDISEFINTPKRDEFADKFGDAVSELDDTYKKSIRKLVYENNPGSVDAFNKMLDANGFIGRYKVVELLDKKFIQLKILLVKSNYEYMFPFRGKYSIYDHKIITGKPKFKPAPLLKDGMLAQLELKEILGENQKHNAYNMYFMLRYKGMSLKHATAIMDQLFELKLVSKEQFLLNTEEDVNEYYDNLFNERLW